MEMLIEMIDEIDTTNMLYPDVKNIIMSYLTPKRECELFKESPIYKRYRRYMDGYPVKEANIIYYDFFFVARQWFNRVAEWRDPESDDDIMEDMDGDFDSEIETWFY